LLAKSALQVEDQVTISSNTNNKRQGVHMNNANDNSPPKMFWSIVVPAFLWNLLGVVAYVSQMRWTEEALMSMPEAERMLYMNVPIWATSAFAIAVNAGALGCLLLILRKDWAFPVLLVSLLGVIIQMYHSFFIANSIEVYGPGGMVMPIMVLGISAFLVWYALHARTEGWIK
jgi:membrane protein CcdC involved in cytochrome C biogenesis